MLEHVRQVRQAQIRGGLHFGQPAGGAEEFTGLYAIGVNLFGLNFGRQHQFDAVVIKYIHQPGKTARLAGLMRSQLGYIETNTVWYSRAISR